MRHYKRMYYFCHLEQTQGAFADNQKQCSEQKIQSRQQTQRSYTEQLVARLKKKQGKLINELQHMTNNLNVLTNQNNKLKAQVDNSRNSRVIYSNVYKNLEKEIRKNQYAYKLAIIESLCLKETEMKVTERIEKAVKKIQREISQLQGIKLVKKREMKKIRLDTGLSTFRASKIGSKDTNRNSSDGKSIPVLQTKRDQILQVNQTTRRDHGKQRKLSLLKYQNEQEQKAVDYQKTQKSMKTRNKIPLVQQINEYYDLEMKSNYYDNIVIQLQKICGEQSLEKLSQYWSTIDAEIEQEYKKYLTAEQESKSMDKEKQLLQGQANKIINSQAVNAEKSVEEMELAAIEMQLQIQKEKLQKFQQRLTQQMDINCRKLTDQEIGHHLNRIKRRGQATSRELDKLLQSAGKDKNHSTSLMTSRLSADTK